MGLDPEGLAGGEGSKSLAFGSSVGELSTGGLSTGELSAGSGTSSVVGPLSETGGGIGRVVSMGAGGARGTAGLGEAEGARDGCAGCAVSRVTERVSCSPLTEVTCNVTTS